MNDQSSAGAVKSPEFLNQTGGPGSHWRAPAPGNRLPAPRFDIPVGSGGYAWWYIDALSAFAACAVRHVNIPVGKDMLPHVHYIRE